MIRLSDFLQSGSIFSAINDIEPLPFITNDDGALMDRMLSLNYGDRIVYDKMIVLSMPQIAEMVLTVNREMWLSLIGVDLTQFDLSTKQNRKVTETIVNSEVKTNTRDDLNKVSAFDTDELMVNDGMTTNATDNTNGDTVRTLTDSTGDLFTLYKNLSLSSKNNIINIVLKDVSDFITLSIY